MEGIVGVDKVFEGQALRKCGPASAVGDSFPAPTMGWRTGARRQYKNRYPPITLSKRSCQ